MAQDDLGYTPIEGEYQLTIPNCTGQFINNGFSVSLYGVPLDSQGFIDGYGDLVNLEFYTADPGSPEFSITGEYKYYDTKAWMDGTLAEKYGPGDMMGGILYEIMPGYVLPMGTMVDLFFEEGEQLGLAGPNSRLIITDKGDGIFNLAVDIYTLQNAHVTGEWEGQFAKFIENCPELSGITSINAETSATEYYNLQGVRVTDPQPGKVYITVTNGKAQKSIIR